MAKKRILVRRDTTVNWTNVNPTLGLGEFGYDVIVKQFKIGDGVTDWINLPFYNGSGGASSYTGTSELDVGGISDGDTFSNASMTEMWDSILKQEKFPTLINPSSTFTLSQIGVYETGEVIPVLNFTSNFNRGNITPAYGTSGFRSGLPNTYNYTGSGLSNFASNSTTDNQIINNYTVVNNNQIWGNYVSYDVGEQPLSSYSNNYDSPLPNGDTTNNTQTITGVYPYYWGVIDEESEIFDGITQSQILSIVTMSKHPEIKGTKIVTTSPTNERYCFMYPSVYNNLTSITDNSGFETLQGYNLMNYDVVGLDGTTQQYNVYILIGDTSNINFTNTYHF